MKFISFYPNSMRSFGAALTTMLFTLLLNVPLQVFGQCNADAGSFSTQQICFSSTGVTLSAVAKGDAIVPDSFQTIYVLTSGDDLVIRQVNAEPRFNIDPNPSGIFTIHTLVYDSTTLDLGTVEIGVTTGGEINALLQQGGGGICGSLDVEGVKFQFGGCEETPTCEATAGTLVAGDAPCLDSTATLTATRGEAPVLPEGYQIAYILTSGEDLVIQAVDTVPSFTVDTTGRFTIHTLVYDTATLNIGIIEFGITTGGDVNALLIQGGGDICAVLDVAGAIFNVLDCDCPISAGALTAEAEACLEDSTVMLTAVHETEPIVADSFQVIYILTSGSNLVIQQVSNSPAFTVDTAGLFTIHTLVYDTTTLNLDSIEIGVTTGGDINALLIQGGGAICAALDVTGAPINVITNCDSPGGGDDCPANAGTLVADNVECLGDTGQVTLLAVHEMDPVVPDSFQLIYVLTFGEDLVIQALDTIPSFTIDSVGLYSIHTLVYDSTTLDLSIIELGVTTGFDIDTLLTQGGGDICAALDVVGAAFRVYSCGSCAANPGRLTYTRAGGGFQCLTDEQIVLSGTTVSIPFVPMGYEKIYVLTFGNDLVIEQVSDLPVFAVEHGGRFRIHTLVYDPTTLDLSTIEFGVTTGFDINDLLVQGGGDICAALDVRGLPFTVRECEYEEVYVYPNPATDCINMEMAVDGATQRISVELLDMNGNIVQQWQFDGGADLQETLNIDEVLPGIYFLRITFDGRLIQQKHIVKAG